MKTQILVKRYTRGLVDATKNEKEYLALKKELSECSELFFGHKELLKVISSPFLTERKKIRIIKEVLAKKKINPKTRRFILLLTGKGRLELLPDIISLFPLLWNEEKGIFIYEISSVVPLEESQKKKLKKRLEFLERKPVILNFKIDSELIGGLSVRKGNIIYDVSLQGSLAKMKEKIIEE